MPRIDQLGMVVSLLLCLILPQLSHAYIPQTIGGLLLERDGIQVSLDAVCVERICARNDPAYFVICDWQLQDSKIVVLGRPPYQLKPGLTVGIEGTLAHCQAASGA